MCEGNFKKSPQEKKTVLGKKISIKSMLPSISQRRKSETCRPILYDQKAYFRIAVHGAGNVGKSCIIQRLNKKSFTTDHIRTVSEVCETELNINEKSLGTLWLYDTAGSFDFPVMNRLTISKSDACIVVYSIDCIKSLQIAEQKLQEIQDLKGKGFPCVLVGNKTDIHERQVTFDTGLRSAVKYSASFIETSAKDNINISDIFETAVKKIYHVAQFEDKLFQYQRKMAKKSYSTKR